jgi:superfamily II DNA/RNA helicase
VTTLREQGIEEPFPIQAAALPDALAGRDVLGRGRTGSGKTLAFGLPMLARLNGRRAAPGRPLAVVLVPTRELALQVTAALTPYARALRLRCATVVGGLSIRAQTAELARGVDVLIATPGRLADLVQRGACRLDGAGIAVIDEADQMAGIGFLPQVTALLEKMPADGQRMLFSATLDRDVERLIRRFLSGAVTHGVDPVTATISTMEHHLLEVESVDKEATIAEIAHRESRVMMFVGTKRRADRLARRLTDRGVAAAALHGGRSQAQRTRALDQFRSGGVHVLVATDVAARGLHIDGLDLIVNVDPPADERNYLHRGGRTARAGLPGTVVTLVMREQRQDVHRLLSAAGVKPTYTSVGPGHPDLARLTGARVAAPPRVPAPAARVAAQPRAGVAGQPRTGGQPRGAGQTRTAGQPRAGGQPRIAAPRRAR